MILRILLALLMLTGAATGFVACIKKEVKPQKISQKLSADESPKAPEKKDLKTHK